MQVHRYSEDFLKLSVQSGM